ncbi:hypothetical protein [Pseudotamlana agarivorans]|uniref:hypothetical protein n=1 Tax=Pseudotamlana agarivorans TaxID=481183 RepID=UPI00082BB44E|nr:hypothetical protein [Tamlana agarivorans]
MIQEELLIEDKRVDLYSDGKINRTLTLNSLGSITAKQSSYSNTIKLPKTANNIKIFDGLGIVGNTSRMPYNRLKCSYLYNSIPIFSNGYCIIDKVTDKEFEISIYNGIIELSEQIKSSTINDLNKSSLTHNLNISNYQLYVNGNHSIYEDDYNFTYSRNLDFLEREDDDFSFDYNNSYSLNETYPLIKTEFIFNSIFEEAGFQIQGDLFTDTKLYSEFKNEYITLKEGYVIPTPQPITLSVVNENTNSIIVDYTGDTQFTSIDDFVGLNPSSSNSELTFIDTGVTVEYDGFLNMTITPHYNINLGEFLDIRYTNDRIGQAVHYFRLNDNSYDDEPFNLIIDVKSGDTINFDIYSSNEEVNGDGRIDYSIYLEITFSAQSETFYTVSGDTLNLGDIKQTDFVKDVLNRYGLILNKKRNTNIFEVKNIDNLLNDKSDAIDYTSKLISIEEESFTHTYAQQNYFKYKYSDSSDAYYDDFFTLDNKLGASQTTVFTSEFEVFPRRSSKKIHYYNPLLTKEEDEFDANNFIYEASESNQKLVKLTKSDTPEEYFIYFNDLVSVRINEYTNISSLPIPFSQVFDDYYSDFINALESYKAVKCKLELNLFDIHEFDFFQLIYLKQTGKYYYVNKLKYNVASPIAEAEMVEIPY